MDGQLKVVSVGQDTVSPFGLTPLSRLRRQASARTPRPELALCVCRDLVLGDPAFDWLLDNAPVLVHSSENRPLAACVPIESAGTAVLWLEQDGECPPDWRNVMVEHLSDVYVRKLRRRVGLQFIDCRADSPWRIEWKLFKSVYKGVTDIVTRYVWPIPAFIICVVCARMRISPNHVTALGLVLTLLAAWLFYRGELAEGIAAAWFMTILDTVDGKLARVTVTSSKLGNILDHGNDLIHPPIWWTLFGYGAYMHHNQDPDVIWLSVVAIFVFYLLGRALEMAFKKRYGFNAFMWRKLDSVFRTIVARRNIVLIFLTFGILLGRPCDGLVAAACWYAISVAIQLVRFWQAGISARSGEIRSWMV